MATASEIQLVYVFSSMLVLGAVLLAFLPAIHRAWTFAASRTAMTLLAAVIISLGVGAIVLVNLAVSDPVYFAPIVSITVGLRLGAPFLLYRRIRDRFDAAKMWVVLRWLVAVAFLGFAASLGYQLIVVASGAESSVIVVLSEQLIMAIGASILIVRGALRVRPRETTEMWPIWSAAVLFALAFVVVLPYAVPVFHVIYAISGLIGWSIACIATVYEV